MTAKPKTLILAIAPNARGFGYTLFLSSSPSKRLIDWGIKEARREKNDRCMALISALITYYRTNTLILEDWQHSACRRSERVKALLAQLAEMAADEGLIVYVYSKQQVKAVFANCGATKDAIATAVSEQVPELLPWLPRKRRIWESEQHSMAIFEAAALALTHRDLHCNRRNEAKV